MKLEKQVTTLKPSKKLKELGVKQDNSLFYWHKVEMYNADNGWRLSSYKDAGFRCLATNLKYDACAAFTVAELGEILPREILYVSFKDNDWTYSWRELYSDIELGVEKDKNEANARAKMLIWLIENGKMKP